MGVFPLDFPRLRSDDCDDDDDLSLGLPRDDVPLDDDLELEELPRDEDDEDLPPLLLLPLGALRSPFPADFWVSRAFFLCSSVM